MKFQDMHFLGKNGSNPKEISIYGPVMRENWLGKSASVLVPPKPMVVGGRVLARRDGNRRYVE
jgi:hypothetical protein